MILKFEYVLRFKARLLLLLFCSDHNISTYLSIKQLKAKSVTALCRLAQQFQIACARYYDGTLPTRTTRELKI
jgi:hypothetical protein